VSVKYLLPCRCGRQIVVETREAGQTSVCPCGQSLPIPTMLEITRLEPAPIETGRPAESTWGWQHRLMLLGVTLFVLAIVGGVLLHRYRPVAPIDAIDPQVVQRIADSLTPRQTWHYWQLMKQGLDRRVDQRYAEKMSLYNTGQGAVVVLALVGVALIVCGRAIDKKKRARNEGREGERPAA
jgi:hypothetical protein